MEDNFNATEGHTERPEHKQIPKEDNSPSAYS